MLREFFLFDARYQLRQPTLWLAAVFFSGLSLACSQIPDAYLRALGATSLGAPLNMALVMSALTMMSAFVLAGLFAGAVLRDFEQNAAGTLFAYPIRPRDYILGRLAAGLTCACVVFIAALLSLVFAAWWRADGPFPLGSTLLGAVLVLTLVVVPNLLLVGAFSVTLACRSRSVAAVYGGAAAFYVVFILSAFPLGSADEMTRAWVGGLLDPFGSRSIFRMGAGLPTEYLNLSFPLDGAAGKIFLVNRMLWISIACAMCLYAAWAFNPSTAKSSKTSKTSTAKKEVSTPPSRTGKVWSTPGSFTIWTFTRQLTQLVRFDIVSSLRSRFARVLAGLSLVLFAVSVLQVSGVFASRSFLTTAWLLASLEASVPLMVSLMAIVLAADIVSRDADSRITGIMMALPVPKPLVRFAQVVALTALLVLFIAAFAVLAWLLQQTSTVAPPVDVSPWLIWVAIQSAQAFLIAALALSIQVLSGNKHLGYFVFGVCLLLGKLVTVFAPGLIHWVYAYAPLGQYSDMNGYGDSLQLWAEYAAGWAAVAAVLLVVAFLLRHRIDAGLLSRRRGARYAVPLASTLIVAFIVVAFMRTSGQSGADEPARSAQAEYELAYKKYQAEPQLRVKGITSTVDLYPSHRSAIIRGTYQLVNTSDRPIDRMYLTVPTDAATTIAGLPAHRVVLDDRAAGFRILQLDVPIHPRETAQLKFDVRVKARKEELLEGGHVMANGTFFNNHDLFPQLGYLRRKELTSTDERRRHGLGERKALASSSTADTKDSHLEGQSDWIEFETTVSTELGQVAISSGDLVKKWDQGTRSFFTYRMPTKMLPYFGFVSGRYSLKTQRVGNIQVEIYVDPKHEANVDRLFAATKTAMGYYGKNLGPYPASTLKLVEVAGSVDAAQSYPGLVVFAEGSELNRDPESTTPDPLTFLVGHEVGHQWWGGQVIGANVAGASVITETLAQYGAMQILRSKEGQEGYEKALQFDKDRYRALQQSAAAEPALAEVDSEAFVYYHKGALVFDALSRLMGREPLNAALRSFYTQYRLSEGRYPTSADLESALCVAADEATCKKVRHLLRTSGGAAVSPIQVASK